ncbi:MULTISPECIES: antibiotic biosynthesis monooxygenase family protein [Thalassolituus]|jgi:hypothetical protein|uniref:antibiotic biosynthesis monooxygenase family protein n=1 Tax=Thalassolituus TaxID=187492 RepID=UPI001B692470|nr:hypothetical protein [Thalassolituus oleivorans]MBQ0725879.1 hypothetical protein [Thalassolituus oleivorans]
MPNQQQPSANATIEWAPYTLKEGIHESDLIQAATDVETQFLKQQPGYLQRQLLKGKDNQWVDLVFWQSEQAAAQAGRSIMQSPFCLKYFAMMQEMDDPNAAPPAHYQVIKHWNLTN